jgi:DinB superfamily
VSDDLRYPVGRLQRDPNPTDAKRAHWIREIAETPEWLRAEVSGLSDTQLDTPYRDGGWTVRQVVHHVPDSHLNAYIRCKLIATEDEPPLKTYQEARWAELVDARTMPIEPSLALLESLHARWVAWLRAQDAAMFARGGTHPEWGVMRIDDLLQVYAWHGRHHTAHIRALKARSGWF